MTKHPKPPPFDWRRVAAACRATPGVWRELPPTVPSINPRRVGRDDYYRGVFAQPSIFEVRGRRRGEQAIRYVGEQDTTPYIEALMRGDLTPLEDYPLHVWPDDWFGLAMHAEGRRPGFALLPLARPLSAVDLPEREPGRAPSAPDEAHTIREAGRDYWPAVAETVRARPGEWFRVLGQWSTMAGQIKRGRVVAFRPADEWEARTRDYELEVRYIGAPDAEEVRA